MPELQVIVYTCLGAVLATSFLRWVRDPLRNIPTVGGPSFPFLSVLGAVNFMLRTDAVLQEGYKKYARGAFKVAMLDAWVVYVSSREAVEDVGRWPDSELSVSESTKQLFETRYTVAREVADDLWHVEIIRSKLSRDLSSVVSDLVDELSAEMGGLDGDIKAWAQQLVARISGRVCVGIPTCHEAEYLALVIKSSESIMKDAVILKLFPDFLKPAVARLAISTRSYMLAGVSHIEEAYRRRIEQMKADSDQEKPNDVLQWLIEGAPPRASDEDIIHRVFAIHLTAIHTSSSVIAQALSDLASYPNHAEVIRAEVEMLVAADGWTKAAIDKMRKLDSFLKESQRCNCVVPFVSLRKAMVDLTLNDGTFIPKGTLVAVPTSPIHHGETMYSNTDTFDPFRFSSMFDTEGPSVTQRFTHTTPTWLTFGYGRHACPGRFFAADMVKAVVAHMLLSYDLRVEQHTIGLMGGLRFGLKPSAKFGGKVMIEERKADTAENGRLTTC